MLVINDERFIERAEIIREKALTAVSFQGEIDKYSWVDIGSSFLPRYYRCFPVRAMENIEKFKQEERRFDRYQNELKDLSGKAFSTYLLFRIMRQ